MLTIILLAVAALVLGLIALLWWDEDGFKCGLGVLSGILDIFVLIVLVTSIVFAIDAGLGKSGEIAANRERYDILVYQLENHLYDDDLVGKKELYNQIQEWNEDLAKGKALQRDLWLGAFYANIYDEFEFIDVEAVEAD